MITKVESLCLYSGAENWPAIFVWIVDWNGMLVLSACVCVFVCVTVFGHIFLSYNTIHISVTRLLKVNPHIGTCQFY